MTCRLSALLALVWCIGAPAAWAACASHTVFDSNSGAAITGIEDITRLGNSSTVVFSAYDRRSNAEGGVFALELEDLTHEAPKQLSATPLFTSSDIAAPLRPHGIALHAADDGITRLAVLNRRAWNSERATDLLVFELADDLRTANLETQTRSSAFCAGNDVAFLTGDTLLVSVDHGACGGPQRMMEDVFNLSRGKVLLVSPVGVRALLSNLRFPNGIAVDLERNKLWVASTRGQEVLEFHLPERLNGAYQDNTPDRRSSLTSSPDNLNVIEGGYVLAAGHQSLLAFAAYRAGWPWPSPPGSAVELINPTAGLAELVLTLREPLLNGATAAVRFGNKLAVTGGFDNKIAVCEMRGLP